MEALLRAFVDNPRPEHTPKLREAFVKKMLDTFLNQTEQQSPQEVNKMLGHLEHFILQLEEPAVKSLAKFYFSQVAKKHPDVFFDFLSVPGMLHIFSTTGGMTIDDRINLVQHVEQRLCLCKELAPDDSDREELKRSIANVTKVQLFNLLREHGVNISLTKAIARMYIVYPSVLPSPNQWSEFTVLVINLLAGYRPPRLYDEEDMQKFAEDCSVISNLLPLIWGQSSDPSSIQECLKVFYVIISSEESYQRPSCALLNVVDKIPRPYLHQAAQTLLDDSGQQQGEAKAVVGLEIMIGWLTMQTAAPVVTEWLLDVLKRLHALERHSILVEIALGCTDKLAQTLLRPHLAAGVEHIFFFLLLGVQHTETVFHSIVLYLPRILGALSTEHTRQKNRKILLQRLGEAVHFLMQQFPAFPDIYKPVRTVLDRLRIKPPSAERIKELRSLSWLSSPVLPDITSINDSAQAQKHLPSFLDESMASRSETGMIGLINLGNTCYMNSVLQALFITKDFCDSALYAPLSKSQVVLHRLQMALSFLRFSQRSLYSPVKFLDVARPPWFETGRQQDCSEFLRYLLDTLHEQEKIGRHGQGENVTTYGEHTVIESAATPMSTSSDAATPTNCQSSLNSPLQDDKTDKSRMDVDDNAEVDDLGAEEELEVITPSTEQPELPEKLSSVAHSIALSPSSLASKVRTPSSLALDVISEAPEDQTRVHDEEENMSQGSDVRCQDDDFFGSRGSLSAFTREGSDEEDNGTVNAEPLPQLSGTEETSLRGSRTSLASSGLKRWTTEENLSMDDGSREGKMDLLDEHGPLNDSHSNSTDSGIQSVGDSSIRGSADSVTTAHSSNAGAAGGGLGTHLRSGQAVMDLTMTGTSPTPSKESPSTVPFVSLVQEHFGGKVETSYSCSKCKSVSVHKEPFNELHLAIPEQNKASKEPLSTQSLIAHYLREERLQDDNQYHCDRCNSLQDAVKTMKILEGPRHLLCTLMRFKYDRTVNRKSKVFTDIEYDLQIDLPRGGQGVNETYELYAIVVHSGYSSDSGHYYTYGREPPGDASGSYSPDSDVWYVFNDSKVSYSTFEDFKSLGKKLPRDTAYQLFYKKVASNEETRHPRKRPLRADLKMAVEKDNVKFLEEKERSALHASFFPTSTVFWKHSSSEDDDYEDEASWKHSSLEDDDYEDEGGSGSGCRGSGFCEPSGLFF